MASSILADFTPEILTQVCGHLDISSILRLVFTGFQPLVRQILRCNKSLLLKHDPCRFPNPLPDIVYRFSALESLTLASTAPNALEHVSSIRLRALPATLRHLKLSGPMAHSLILLCGTDRRSRTTEEFKAIFPSLESLHVADHRFKTFPKKEAPVDWRPLFDALPRLTSLELHGEEVRCPYLDHLPRHITHLSLKLFLPQPENSKAPHASTSTPTASHPSEYHLPPNLESLEIQHGNLRFTAELLAALPATLTRFKDGLCSMDQALLADPGLFWKHLPPRLVSLELGPTPSLDMDCARSLPQSLTRLTTTDCTSDATEGLPHSLQNLELMSWNHTNISATPETWPPNLKHANVYMFSVRPTHWKRLPRTMRSPTLYIRDPAEKYVADLPPLLQGIVTLYSIAPAYLATMGCLKSLKTFHWECNETLVREHFEALANCPMLTALTIQGRVQNPADISLLNCQLEEFILKQPQEDVNVAEDADDESETIRVTSTNVSSQAVWCYADFTRPWASKLARLMISAHSGRDIVMPPDEDSEDGNESNPRFTPSMTQWIADLPRNLRSLEIMPTTLPVESWGCLPPTLRDLYFCVNPSTFSVRALSTLPKALVDLQIYVVTENSVVYKTSIQELSECLPPRLGSFQTSAYSGVFSNVRLELTDPPTKDLKTLFKPLLVPSRLGLMITTFCPGPYDFGFAFGQIRQVMFKEMIEQDLIASSLEERREEPIKGNT